MKKLDPVASIPYLLVPNFRVEKKSLNPEYANFVQMQLNKPKKKLGREFHAKIGMLAWSFGIYDDELVNKAMGVRYLAALSME